MAQAPLIQRSCSLYPNAQTPVGILDAPISTLTTAGVLTLDGDWVYPLD
jgi:hypothetical protein